MNKNTTDPAALARELNELPGTVARAGNGDVAPPAGVDSAAAAGPQAGAAPQPGSAAPDAPAALSLPQGGGGPFGDPEDALLVARVVRGFSQSGWQEFCRAYPLSQWYALPVPDELATGVRLADLRAEVAAPGPAVAGDALLGALGSTMFAAQLERELLRLGRNGGGLSLVAASVAGRHALAVALGEGTVTRLERLLGETLACLLEACDSLGISAPGRYAVLLPGMGQLRTRRFTEKAQAAFSDAARPFFPTGGISAGAGAECALGVIHVSPDSTSHARDLLTRAESALEAALEQDEGHIHQEMSGASRQGETLVHSGEKRFLFFGGESQ